MVLQHIKLKDFRFHEAAEFAFGPGVNLICGPNGTGKTNILEAIHFLALTKGFLTSSDEILLRRESTFFEIVGRFAGERRSQITVRTVFAKGVGKKLFVNGSEIERKADHVGTIPVVLLCPQDQALTAGSPAERRRFLDTIISQSSAAYLENLFRYRRALRQRNALLQSLRRPGPFGEAMGGKELLESWTNELVETGADIIASRSAFCDAFSDRLSRAYERLGDVVERPRLSYSTIDLAGSDPTDRESIVIAFRNAAKRLSPTERSRGVTMAGPHRDDLKFSLDRLNVRRYASQGQHRTFGMALKLAQYDYLREETGERPILLLDDVFDNLDGTRIALFLEILSGQEMGQTIITAARREILDRFIEIGDENVRMIELPEDVTGRREKRDLDVPVEN